jgi:hypothetical protein
MRIYFTYFSFRLKTHSATPVSMPNATSGRIHSGDTPNMYASNATTQQEATTQNAIAKESGSLSMCAPFWGAAGAKSSERRSCTDRGISTQAFKGHSSLAHQRILQKLAVEQSKD